MKIKGNKKFSFTRKGTKYYLLGQDENGQNLFLVEPSFDCDWYYSIGYIQSFTNNNNPAIAKDINMHTHFDYFIGFDFDKFYKTFPVNPFQNNEVWKILEYMKTLYTIRKYSDLLYTGSSNITGNNAKETIQNQSEYERINKIVIPAIWKKLEIILTGKEE